MNLNQIKMEIAELQNKAIKKGYEIGGTKSFSHIKVPINKGNTIIRVPLWVADILDKVEKNFYFNYSEEQFFKVIYGGKNLKGENV